MITLLSTVLRRRVIEVMRYPLELVSGIVIFYLFFLMLFLGARTFGGESVRTGDTLSAIAIGYVVFVLAQQSYQAIGQQLLLESTQGTLEQLAMSPVGLRRVLLTDFFSQTLIFGCTFGIVIFPIMLTTGRWLHFDLGVVPILAVMMSGIVGVGLTMGGLAIVFKRIQTLGQIVGFTFLLLVAAPVRDQPFLKLLPLAHGNTLLREVTVNRLSLIDIGAAELLTLLAVNGGWMLLGLIVFGRMEKQARQRALLGQY